MFPILLSKLFSTLPRRPPRRRRERTPQGTGFVRATKRINLALQGGGAHGAFTWGVLDQLLADGRFAIDGISGASAGAVNAVMLADGLARGGPQEAQTRLAEFWRAASFGGTLPELQRGVVERLFSFVPRDTSPAQSWFGAMSRVWSPYDFNPLNINPLKDLVERFVDFEAIRDDNGSPLFVSATDVRTGSLRVFSRKDISAEAVMASACVPLLFHAVEIDGVPYWDGGYSGNPAVLPFLRSTATEDVLIVQINPLERHKVPTSTREIINRVHEITFNASLLAELRAIDFVGKLIDDGRLPRGTGPGEYRRLRLHRIVLDGMGEALDARSKLNNDYEFYDRLRKLGQEAAQRFLDAHFNDVGVRSTIDESRQLEREVA